MGTDLVPVLIEIVMWSENTKTFILIQLKLQKQLRRPKPVYQRGPGNLTKLWDDRQFQIIKANSSNQIFTSYIIYNMLNFSKWFTIVMNAIFFTTYLRVKRVQR